MAKMLQLLKKGLSEAREYVRLKQENHLTKVTYDYQYSKCAVIKQALGNHGR